MEDQSQNPGQYIPEVPESPERRSSDHNLGVASLITAIITFVLAVIPCVGLMAIIPGIITLVLASVGLSRSGRNDSHRGLLVAGLILGIVATLISFSQIFFAAELVRKADKWPHKIEKIVDGVQKDIDKIIEDASVNIRIENGDDKVEIRIDTDKKGRQKILEELETGKSSAGDTLSIPENEMNR